MKPIKVVDSIMGSGKTSWAIQHMNANKGPFLYVTPYLTEIDRILKACDGFVQPDTKGTGSRSKTDNLRQLLAAERSIATTHELFKRLDAAAVALIQAAGYFLIMDEVMDVIQPVQLRGESIQALLAAGVLIAADEGKAIRKILPGPQIHLDRYADIRTWAEEDRLVMVNGTLLMWLFPADVFQAFKAVFNLSYLFPGSYQKAYYDMHGLSYEMLSVNGTKVNDPSGVSWMDYRLVPWTDSQVSPELAGLIDIYAGPMNQIGDADFSLSHSWFMKHNSRPVLKKLGNDIYNYFRNVARVKSPDVLWTVPKDSRKQVSSSKGYAGGFLSRTTRATNAYDERSALAYGVNVFMRPDIAGFFKDRGVYLDQDLYALSEMIQWIWRSRIRNGKPVSIFIPSRRMRGLLQAWLAAGSDLRSSGQIQNQKAA